MLAKAACVFVLTYQLIRCMIPPKSSKTTKDDKVKQEGRVTRFFIRHVQQVAPISVVFVAALYLVLMFKGYLSSELKAWHIAATVSGMLGWQLRSWAFKTLDHFFTYELTIRPGHRLVTTGPYTHLRHPSYTGMLLAGIPWTVFMLYQGPYDALLLPVTHVPLTLPMAVLAASLYFCGFVVIRVKAEERMLREHFGSTMWDEYCSTRAMLVPYLL